RRPPITPRSAAGQVAGTSPAQIRSASRAAVSGPSLSASATRATRARRPPRPGPLTAPPGPVTDTGSRMSTRTSAGTSVGEPSSRFAPRITQTLRTPGGLNGSNRPAFSAEENRVPASSRRVLAAAGTAALLSTALSLATPALATLALATPALATPALASPAAVPAAHAGRTGPAITLASGVELSGY